VVTLLALSAVHGTARQATFSSKVEVVRVDVLVTDGGQVVRGLQPGDFEVRDDGVLQTVDLVASEKIPLNVILALDSSGSVSGQRLDDLQKASRALLERLNQRDKAALLTFSHAIELREKLTSDIGRVRDALSDAAPTGATALIDGTYAAMQLAEADGGRNLLIVFSDGLDTASWLDPERVIAWAKRSEVVVYSAMSRQAEESRFLEDLTETTGGGLVKIASTKDLSAAFLRILDEFRNRHLISYSPAGVSNSGWHRLRVRLKGRRGTVKARAGYQAGS
jgi:VWFA-related protein